MASAARMRRSALPYTFVAPVAFLLMLVNFYPMLYSLRLSLSKWPIEKLLEGPSLTGFQNFAKMTGDERLWGATKFMVAYTVGSVVLQFVLGTGIALLLDAKLPARNSVRSIVITPLAVSPLVAALTWRYLLNGDYGVLNWSLSLVGIKGVAWLSTTPWAQIAVILVEVWQHTPFVALVLLAGLQGIPDDYVEAARIDGASAWRIFWGITLPLLRPAILVAAVIRTTNAVRQFDLSFALTGGGPFGSTETYSYVAYMNAFQGFDLTYAAAISWLIFLLNLAITLLFVRVLYVKVEV